MGETSKHALHDFTDFGEWCGRCGAPRSVVEDSLAPACSPGRFVALADGRTFDTQGLGVVGVPADYFLAGISSLAEVRMSEWSDRVNWASSVSAGDSDDGVALNAAAHPRVLPEPGEPELSFSIRNRDEMSRNACVSAAISRYQKVFGANGGAKTQAAEDSKGCADGRLFDTWRSPRPYEVAPAVDAESGSLHWVRQARRSGTSDSNVAPLLMPDAVWLWTGHHWQHDGVGDFPSCAFLAGWRYLGPANQPRTDSPPVTPDMIEAAKAASEIEDGFALDEDFAAIYRAMHAVAPVPLVSEAEDRSAELTKERDEARRDAFRLHSMVRPGVSVSPHTDNSDAHLIWWPDKLPIPRFNPDGTFSLLPTTEPGNHDYNGPTETVPHPDLPGRTVQRAVSDPVHENFHRAVGDVLAGKVIPAARRQMQEALKSAPKESTHAPDAILRGNKASVGMLTGSREGC